MKLMALLVIAVKLFYSFDSFSRHPRALSDIGSVHLDWEKWTESQRKYEAIATPEGGLARGDEIRVNSGDVLNMSSTQLDQYLDWYERTWVDGERAQTHPRGSSEQLLDMFPLMRPNGSMPDVFIDHGQEMRTDQKALEQKLQDMQSHLRPSKVISIEEERRKRAPVTRMGSFYKRYRRIEDMPSYARTFYEVAAQLIGSTLKSLMVAVLQIESKMQTLGDTESKSGARGNDDKKTRNRAEAIEDRSASNLETSMDVDQNENRGDDFEQVDNKARNNSNTDRDEEEDDSESDDDESDDIDADDSNTDRFSIEEYEDDDDDDDDDEDESDKDANEDADHDEEGEEEGSGSEDDDDTEDNYNSNDE